MDFFSDINFQRDLDFDFDLPYCYSPFLRFLGDVVSDVVRKDVVRKDVVGDVEEDEQENNLQHPQDINPQMSGDPPMPPPQESVDIKWPDNPGRLQHTGFYDWLFEFSEPTALGSLNNNVRNDDLRGQQGQGQENEGQDEKHDSDLRRSIAKHKRRTKEHIGVLEKDNRELVERVSTLATRVSILTESVDKAMKKLSILDEILYACGLGFEYVVDEDMTSDISDPSRSLTSDISDPSRSLTSDMQGQGVEGNEVATSTTDATSPITGTLHVVSGHPTKGFTFGGYQVYLSDTDFKDVVKLDSNSYIVTISTPHDYRTAATFCISTNDVTGGYSIQRLTKSDNDICLKVEDNILKLRTGFHFDGTYIVDIHPTGALQVCGSTAVSKTFYHPELQDDEDGKEDEDDEDDEENDIPPPLEPIDDYRPQKEYLDQLVKGVFLKEAVDVATTEHVDDFTEGSVIDGVVLKKGMRVLDKDHEGLLQGIWVVSDHDDTSRRASDMMLGDAVSGSCVYVTCGKQNGNKTFVVINDEGKDIIGKDTIQFTQFNGSSICI